MATNLATVHPLAGNDISGVGGQDDFVAVVKETAPARSSGVDGNESAVTEVDAVVPNGCIDNIDNQYATDSFVPRATLAAKCPLLDEDEVIEEKLVGEQMHRAEGVAAEFDGGKKLDELKDEPEEMMMFHLTERQAPKWFIIMPGNPRRQWWDLLVVICVLYNTAVVPLDVAFDLGDAINILNYVTDGVIFGGDMLVHCVSAFVHPKDGLVVEPHRVLTHYVSTMWFWIDLVSTVPWDIFLAPLNTENTQIVFKALGAVKLLRLLRLSKFFRWLKEVLGSYASAVRLFQLFFIFMLCAHTVGCLYWWLDATIYGKGETALRGLNAQIFEDQDWFLQLDCLDKYSQQNQGKEGLDLWAELSPSEKSECIKMGNLYLDLFYMGVQGLVGEGLGAAGVGTTMFLALSSIVGCGLAAIIFGNVADVVANTQSLSGHIKAKTEMINDTLLALELPQKLRERISEFHEFKLKRMGGSDDHIYFNELSPAIQMETRAQANMLILKQQDLYETLPDMSLRQLAASCSHRFFGPHDVVFREGDVGESMFIVAFGFVLVTSSLHNDKFTRSQSRDGVPEYFGEMAVFRLKAREPSVIPLLHAATSKRRTGTAMSITYSELVEIPASGVAPILRLRGSDSTNAKLWKGFKHRAMMLNMLCKSLVWITVDRCFFKWRSMIEAVHASQTVSAQIAGVHGKMDKLRADVTARFDRIEEQLGRLLTPVSDGRG